MRKLISILLIFLLIFPAAEIASGEENGDSEPSFPFGIFESIFQAIASLPGKVADAIQNSFVGFVNVLLGNFGSSIASSAGSIYSLDLSPLNKLVEDANKFLAEFAFSVTCFSFFLSLCFYVAPLDMLTERWKAIGKVGAMDACLAVLLISFYPAIHHFFKELSSALSATILQSMDSVSFRDALINYFFHVINPLNWIFFVIIGIFLLIALTIILVSLILQPFAPTVFLIGVLIYSLPFATAKNVANKIFVESIMLYFLAPLGFALYVIDYIIIATVPTLLTPLAICLIDLMILKLYFDVSREIGATYPVLETLRNATAAAIFVGTFLLAPRALRPVLGAAYIARGKPVRGAAFLLSHHLRRNRFNSRRKELPREQTRLTQYSKKRKGV
jgi:hypothetical protein